TYTRAQLNLLQAIADQTAGAIIKARLLQESERRTRQLTTLNEITRQLTSTLELEPLLQNMLESAVRILNCEAGSLFLVDEATDELVFKVTTGPVAKNLLGQRLPPGSGIVGRAVITRSPVIVNDVQNSPGWFSQTDEQTGFVTKAVLAVPLEAKERVIGVIEVINKRDGLPFGEDDQALLTAFASQAAIAIENARLYTLTDQELAARVEELSVMQRIDRELNASLEIERAMRITLEWAMRQSDADAGMIGILEEEGLRLMAHEGYGDLLAAYSDTPLPLEQPELRAAIEARQAQRLSLSANGGGFLPGARTQVVVPIRREAEVIGLILLESLSEDKSDRPLTFLNRLSDHAAIAIANAQLYAEVQAANLAKSEFVSLVAHELKNPMTSIKGYTELLAAGAVGPINESQANFLNTIRSNVERMAILVSDLNDQSKIEAGRLRLEFKAVDVREVVDEVLRASKRQIEEKRQTITVQLAEDLPRVWADRTRLGQVITNLVSNANKYTPPEGKILIGAEESENHWDPQGARKVVHIWVQDNGIGIAPEDQKKIFQKFFRSEDEKAR
ncbi:MAG: GAF domain-containing protein, partial [Anaerolineae bacterium]